MVFGDARVSAIEQSLDLQLDYYFGLILSFLLRFSH